MQFLFATPAAIGGQDSEMGKPTRPRAEIKQEADGLALAAIQSIEQRYNGAFRVDDHVPQTGLAVGHAPDAVPVMTGKQPGMSLRERSWF